MKFINIRELSTGTSLLSIIVPDIHEAQSGNGPRFDFEESHLHPGKARYEDQLEDEIGGELD